MKSFEKKPAISCTFYNVVMDSKMFSFWLLFCWVFVN